MKIYNTLTREKEEFKPRKDLSTGQAGKKVQMFVCGPTVYDYIHIGNARTFVIFDVVAKYLRYRGYDVNYIQNITDIDNKIIERAQKENVDPLEYAKKYSDIFKQDMQALGVTAPEYKNATDHIPEVIKQVQTLLDKGNTYVIENDGIYFDLSTFPDYGKLSGRTASMADDAISRIDDSDKKRNRGDFALWKFSQAGDPSWPALFGAGRPGWHIEDTAITEKYFGHQYDIHGGGQDLIFPHHEAEIAQQESVSNLKPFVKYWMHSGFLVNKDEKMSKSLGNFETLRDVLNNCSSEVLRFYFLSNHYRAPLDFTNESLNSAQAAINRVTETLHRLDIMENKTGGGILGDLHEKARNEFTEAMDDDFNTPRAFATIFDFIRNINGILSQSGLSTSDSNLIKEFFVTVNKSLGIIPAQINRSLPQEIQKLIDERQQARDAKDFAKSDQLRQELKNLGYRIEDTTYGPLVVKNNHPHQ